MLGEAVQLTYADGAPEREDSGHFALITTVQVDHLLVQVATTHLRWDPPGTATESRWALRQLRELIAALRAPAIICGDFNVEPDDPVLGVLAEAGFRDPLAARDAPTANPNGRAKRIDYVWYTHELAALPVPTAPVADDTPLPSRSVPSDHVPIAVEFTALE